MTIPVEHAKDGSFVIHAECGLQPVRKCGTGCSCVPLPPGEGAAKRRVRGKMGPSSGPSATFSRREKDSPARFLLSWTPLVIDRPYSESFSGEPEIAVAIIIRPV